MKKLLLILSISALSLFFGSYASAVCPTAHFVQHDGAGAVSPVCTPSGSCLHTPRYFCLSGESANNNGTNTSWWQLYSGTVWWYNGSWDNAGVNGCCGMWDASSFDSRTMWATVEIATNEGSTSHAGQADIEVRERPTAGTSYFFTRATNYAPVNLPIPKVSSFTSTGPGGTSTLTISQWATGSSNMTWWYQLENGTTGTYNGSGALPLNPRCSPGGTSACPNPVAGYRIVAMTRGCADGTCTNPAPAPPTTSVASSWNMTLTGNDINGQAPTFPVSGVTITNPATNTAANAYIYIATIMRYNGGVLGVYTSGNSPAFKWGALAAEVSGLTANYINTSNIKVDWKSVAEGLTSAYNVYRSFSPTGTFTRVNRAPIPASGIDGTSYSYTDRIISGMQRTVYYKISVVRPNGSEDIQPDIAVAKGKPSPAPKL